MKKLFLFFDMTEQERRGFLALLFIIILISLFPYVHRSLLREPPGTVPTISWITEPDEDNGHAFASRQSQNTEATRRIAGNAEKAKGRLFYFDPNHLPEERWRALGFSDKQIAVIKNYEAKGGKFYQASDLAKIYSISAEEFKRIAPYL